MLFVHTGILQILGDSFMKYGTKACSCPYKHNTSLPLEDIRYMHCSIISSNHLWPTGTCTRHMHLFSHASTCYGVANVVQGETQQFQTSTLSCFDSSFQVPLRTYLSRAEFHILSSSRGCHHLYAPLHSLEAQIVHCWMNQG